MADGLPLTNTFAGGTNGVAISTPNSGGASGDAFDQISGSLCLYSSTQQLDGLSMQIAQGATYAGSSVWWGTGNAGKCVGQGNILGSFCLYPPANPNVQMGMISTVGTDGLFALHLQLTTGGLLQVLDANGATVYTGSTAVTLNQWGRWDFRIQMDGSAGQVETWQYTDPNASDTSAAVEHLSASSVAMKPDLGIVRVGHGIGTGPTSQTFYWARVKLRPDRAPTTFNPIPFVKGAGG